MAVPDFGNSFLLVWLCVEALFVFSFSIVPHDHTVDFVWYDSTQRNESLTR